MKADGQVCDAVAQAESHILNQSPKYGNSARVADPGKAIDEYVGVITDGNRRLRTNKGPGSDAIQKLVYFANHGHNYNGDEFRPDLEAHADAIVAGCEKQYNCWYRHSDISNRGVARLSSLKLRGVSSEAIAHGPAELHILLSLWRRGRPGCIGQAGKRTGLPPQDL